MTSIYTRRSAVTLIHSYRNRCHLSVVVFIVVAVTAAAPRSGHEALARSTFDHSVRPTADDHVHEISQHVEVQRTHQDARDHLLSSPIVNANATTEKPVSTTVPADSSTTFGSSTTPDSSTMSSTMTDSTTVTDPTTVPADSSTVSDPFTVLDSTAVPIIATTTESDMSLQIPGPPVRHDTPTTISTTPMPSVSSAASCRTVFLIPFVAVAAALMLTA